MVTTHFLPDEMTADELDRTVLQLMSAWESLPGLIIAPQTTAATTQGESV